MSTGETMSQSKSEVLQGTLDMMVLKILESLGPMHGWGVARRIQQISDNALRLSQGTIYPALLRLEQHGWIAAEWGISSNNRKARFYSLTRSGRKKLHEETESWEQTVAIINRVLAGT
jgi:transcriptional regulator